MDIPSSSNVTGRRKRTVAPDEDFDPLTQSARLRQVRGTKQSNAQNLASNGLMDQVNSHVDDIVNKRKVGALNCFEYKSPLELYGIEKMVEANASIQEMAIVLESAQVILGYRVDRLHHDVRQVDSAISSGDMSRGNGTDDVHLNVENRKARKKMAITDGMNGMSDFLNQIDDEQYAENIRREALENNAEAQWNGDGEDDNGNAGEPRIDPTANSMDVDLFTQRDVFIGDLIKSLAIERAVHFQAEIAQEASAFVSADDTCHDIKDSSIDWLKTNPTFQKATKGSLDNTATSFHSLNHLGLHSPSGRTLILHPRIQDKHADDRFFTSDVTASLANNTRALLENSLSKKPAILENYLMLEVRDRPVIGRYKIMAKDVKKSTLPLAEASRERDLANLTFAEMNRFNSTDMTVIGSSDMSMLPGVRGLPLSIGDNDETIAIDAPNLNQTVSQSRVAKDEYVPPNLEALALEEALIGRIPMDPMDMDELTKIFEEKINDYNTSDFIESKVWQNGMRAEEWGKDDETSLNAVTRNTFCAGIDGWIKATDSWTNYDVVKMPVNREIKQQLEENAADEQDSYRNMVPDIGKNIFLVKSDDFMNNYPTDRFQELKIVGEELDVMKMTPGFDGEDEDVTLEQIQKEIQNRNELDMDPEPMDDMDYDASAVEVDFDDRLAAPADDDEMIERPNANNDDGHVADILFGDQLEEREQEAFDENVRQRNIEDIALGADEVPELMTGSAPEQLVGPSAEMRDEIRNIGKHDNAHWLPPEIANKERQDLLIAQRKKKEKKTKSKKVTVEEYVHYFRDISEEELEREETIVKCEKIMDEKSIFLSEQQVYLPTLGTENKPHVALDLTTLTSSGLFFKKGYGKLKLERIKNQRPEGDVYIDDAKGGNKDSDCLNWLLSFSGFRCMENPEPVTTENDNTNNDPEPLPIFPEEDEEIGDPNYFDDEFDRYNPRFGQEMAAAAMGPENQKKLAYFSSNLYTIQDILPRGGEYGDSDDEFADSFDRQSIQAKNLDAAKHKKCLADILNNDTLSMPSIQYALEQLTINNQTFRQNSTVNIPSTSDRNERSNSPSPTADTDSTLTTVFDYQSPSKMNHDVHEIIKALTDMSDYVEEDPRSPKKPATSKYGTANTENRKVKINGFHTLLSLALSMPPKMGESVKPSSIVSFILHVANENSLKIVQDRSKRTWMSDFVVLNQADALPRGLKIGKIEDMDEFWKKTQDPDAIQGSSDDQAPMFASLIQSQPSRLKAVPTRRGRQAQRAASPVELGAIAEEEEEMDL